MPCLMLFKILGFWRGLQNPRKIKVVMLCYCLCILKFASFVVLFSVLWLKSPSVFLYFNFHTNIYVCVGWTFRSGSSILTLVGLVFWFFNRFSSREEQMLILLDYEPKEAMSQDAIVALFILFLKVVVLCLFWVHSD